MSGRTLWISAFGFVALLALTLWALSRRPHGDETPYFSLKHRTPDTLWVAYRGDTTVVVQGGVNGWQVVAPVRDAADEVVVNAMIHHLTPLEIEDRYPLTPEKMDTYGMRIPRAEIRAAYRALPPDTLLVGAFGLNASWDYVRAGHSGEVALVDDRIARTYLLKELHDLRDTQLIPFHESRAETLRLRGRGGVLNLEAAKHKDGSWTLSKPYPGPVTPKKIREYLASLSHMHIELFADRVPLEGGGTGLESPQVSVEVVTQSGRTAATRLGREVPGTNRVYALTAGRPFVLEVSNKYPPVLLESADAFRESAPVTFGLTDVDSVQIRTVRGTGMFRLGSEITPKRARATWDVLGNWVLLRADGFREATPGALRSWGLAGPGPGLTWMAGGDTLAVVRVGRARHGEVPVRVAAGSQARPEEILLLPEGKAVPLWSYLEREGVRSPP